MILCYYIRNGYGLGLMDLQENILTVFDVGIAESHQHYL